MAATEKTPLVPGPAAAVETQDTGATRGVEWGLLAERLFMVPVLAVQRHWGSLLCALASILLCWGSGHASENILDPVIFKTIFVVFGFALGFRNVRAGQRREQALQASAQLFHTSWGILALFPPASMRKIARPLTFVLHALVRHVDLLNTRKGWWFGIAGLEPSQQALESKHSWAGTFDGHFHAWEVPPEGVGKECQLGPDAVTRAFFVLANEEIEGFEKMPQQARKRILWAEKASFQRSFETIQNLSLPAFSDRYKALVDTCLCAFCWALPWGITVNPQLLSVTSRTVQAVSHWHVALLLGLNTLLVATVFLGLNALAEETEDPFKGQTEDVNLEKHLQTFEEALAALEQRTDATLAEPGAASGQGPDPQAFDRHFKACGYGISQEAVVPGGTLPGSPV